MADTFTGVVNAGPEDSTYVGGEHGNVSIQEVQDLIEDSRISNVELLVSEFPSETGNKVRDRLCFVHIDVDVYDSAKNIWEWCTTKLSSGSVVVFDDFGFSSTDGITKFVNEIAGDEKYLFIHNLNGHAIMVKR